MSLSMPTGEIFSGMLYITPTSVAPEGLPIPTTANSTLTTDNLGNPLFIPPLTYLTLVNSAINRGIPFPSLGSPPVQATADIYGGVSIPYATDAYTGLSITLPAPVTQNFATWLLTFSIPIYAKSLNITSTGGQTLSGIMLALYDSQTATVPVAKAYLGNAGSLYYSTLASVSFAIDSATFAAQQNLYVCAFFDSQWATSDMGLVLNGYIDDTNTVTTLGGQIAGTIAQIIPSNQYIPT